LSSTLYHDAAGTVAAVLALCRAGDGPVSVAVDDRVVVGDDTIDDWGADVDIGVSDGGVGAAAAGSLTTPWAASLAPHGTASIVSPARL